LPRYHLQNSPCKPRSHYVRTGSASIHRKHNTTHTSNNLHPLKRPIFKTKRLPLKLTISHFKYRLQLPLFENVSMNVCSDSIVEDTCEVCQDRKPKYKHCKYGYILYLLFSQATHLLCNETLSRCSSNVYKYLDFLKVPYLIKSTKRFVQIIIFALIRKSSIKQLLLIKSIMVPKEILYWII